MRNRVLVIALLLMVLPVFAAPEVIVGGLFKGKAVLTIDGVNKVLKVGQSYRGVTLLASDLKSARVRIDGREFEMGISTRISTTFQQPEFSEVRIPQSEGGHYFVHAVVNGHRVKFMVDTGATNVSMSADDAQRYGIRYQDGQIARVGTAAGVVDAYMIKLSSLTIGGIKLHGVDAAILPGNFPQIPLLGNSFLGMVDITQKQGVLVLKNKF